MRYTSLREPLPRSKVCGVSSTIAFLAVRTLYNRPGGHSLRVEGDAGERRSFKRLAPHNGASERRLKAVLGGYPGSGEVGSSARSALKSAVDSQSTAAGLRLKRLHCQRRSLHWPGGVDVALAVIDAGLPLQQVIARATAWGGQRDVPHYAIGVFLERAEGPGAPGGVFPA